MPRMMVTILSVFAISLLSVSCNGANVVERKDKYFKFEDVPQIVWKKLSDKKLFFGHRSVGQNIVEGIQDIVGQHPDIKLDIVETTDAEAFHKGIFAHAHVGQNSDPEGKIKEFGRIMEKGLGEKAEFAALKLCYVDVTDKTKLSELFATYTQAVEKIQKNHPDVHIVHFTVPLLTIQTTWKTWLKKLLRKKDMWEYNENVKRNEYNELLKEKYEPYTIFDIAEIESTFPDGKRSSFKLRGKTYYSLVPEYTDDGGHLNEAGRMIVAKKFLVYLANRI